MYKTMAVKLRFFTMTVLLPLLFASCEEIKELIDPGPNTSFWIELTVDTSIAKDFLPVRVIVQTDETETGKTGQLGQVAVSPISGAQRYKITLPEAYVDRWLDFVVEFRKIDSAFDEVDVVKNVPMALNLLKSRYCLVRRHIPAKTMKDIDLTVPKGSELILGYGPNGINLSDIPNAPLIYLLNIMTDESMDDYGFKFIGALAVRENENPSFTDVIEHLNEGVEGIYGFSLPELDWGMVMLPSYTEGTPFDILVFAQQEPGADICPCESCDEEAGNGCTYPMSIISEGFTGLDDILTGSAQCPYKFAAELGYYHTIRESVTKEELEDNNMKETGSTIRINIFSAELESCEVFRETLTLDLLKAIPTDDQ